MKHKQKNEKMIIKEKLASYLKKIGIEDAKIASLFNEDGTELTETAIDTLLQHDATRVQKLKDTGTQLFNDGHKKGLSEGAGKIEKEITEKYGIKSDKLGIELIDEVIASKSTTGTEIDEEKIKLHPAFVKMADDLNKQIKNKDKEWDDKFKLRDSEIAKQNLFKEIVGKGKLKALEHNPILPKDQAKAERQMELLVAAISKLEYNKTEDGNDYILSKDGKPVEDAHGNRITFDQFIKSETESIWELGQGQQRQSTGNNNDNNGTGTQGKWVGKTPTNKDEYIAAIGSAKDATERMAIADAFESANKQN